MHRAAHSINRMFICNQSMSNSSVPTFVARAVFGFILLFAFYFYCVKVGFGCVCVCVGGGGGVQGLNYIGVLACCQFKNQTLGPNFGFIAAS